ncbi:hypothetical protein DMC47_08870 [Nostoc sp. 3335mG]|nr:hypothetical protein DMC47_08870 [Nostoc sp. 3335mG]
MTGVESGFIGISAILDYIRALRDAKQSEPIEVYITGYSRGGMIALYVADRIHRYNEMNGLLSSGTSIVKRAFGYTSEEPLRISIPSVVLFDAVDSDVTLSANTLPPSVGQLDHFVCGETSSMFGRSRWYFNRIEVVALSSSTKIRKHKFHATHSAMGGMPGGGDHQIPATRSDILSAGVAEALSAPALPANRVVGFVSGAAGRAWDSVKSDVTLKDDEDTKGPILAKLNDVLRANNWPVKGRV